MVIVVIVDNLLYWSSVGDSRIYLLRDRQLSRITTDQIYGRELEKEIESGSISKKEAFNNKEWFYLTHFIGMNELPNLQQNVNPFQLKSGDNILLCSDGLHASLTEDELFSIMVDNREVPRVLTQKLVKATLKKKISFQDNISVVDINI
jgi:protein phosphatase